MIDDENDESDVWYRLAFRSLWVEDENQNVASMDSNVDGCSGSGNWTNSLGYGEITEQTVFAVIRSIRQILQRQSPTMMSTSVEVMVDLGSGAGRVVLAAAIAVSLHLKMAVGLEILPGLHRQAMLLQNRWNEEAVHLAPTRPCLDFQCCDFTTRTDWIDSADLIFMHCTVFEDSLFELACDLCSRVKPGTWIVTVSRRLQSAEAFIFECVSELQLELSWGLGRVYVQRKL
jgi:Histone methylation protein DOT1